MINFGTCAVLWGADLLSQQPNLCKAQSLCEPARLQSMPNRECFYVRSTSQSMLKRWAAVCAAPLARTPRSRERLSSIVCNIAYASVGTWFTQRLQLLVRPVCCLAVA